MPKIPVQTYYLETRSEFSKQIQLPNSVTVELWNNPRVKEYLKIYNEVGENWGWTGHNVISKKALQKQLNAPTSEVYLLKIDNQLAGFVEIEKQLPESVELKYLGLLNDFIGKGLGKLLIELGIEKAWEHHPERVWVHTCEFDHPMALDVYQKAGFQLIKQQVETEFYENEFLKKRNRV